MDKKVMTRFGPGEIVSTSSSRGQTDHLVKGDGFEMWVKDAELVPFGQFEEDFPEVDYENSTTLPYNPEPQNPSFLDDGSSTIQPGQTLDVDKRTSPADSVTFKPGEGIGPGPNPALFANSRPHEDRSPGDKFAEIVEPPKFDDLEWRLANDLEAVIREYSEKGKPVDPAHFEAISLEASMEAEDPIHKEAAWKDVAAKARRLRSTGQVMTQAANPRVITTIVNGDHDVYDCLIVRGNILEGNSAVTQWSCSCPWGQWAFKREHTFVGRLCSHAYASLIELQALHKSKDNSQRQRFWTDDPHRQTIQFSNKQASHYSVGDKAFASGIGSVYVVECDNAGYLVKDMNGGEYFVDDTDLSPMDVADDDKEFWATKQAGLPLNFPFTSEEEQYRDMALDAMEDPDSEEEFRSLMSFYESEYGLSFRPEAFELYSDGTWMEDREATRHPRPDGRLSTEPGTLDTELNHIPKVRNQWRERVALFPGTDDTLSEPFNGSGVVEKDSWGTSAQYLEEHPPHLVSLGSNEGDPVQYINPDEFTAHAIQAGRVFTLAEQADLENEFDGNPYDRSRLDLRGTHYEGGA